MWAGYQLSLKHTAVGEECEAYVQHRQLQPSSNFAQVLCQSEDTLGKYVKALKTKMNSKTLTPKTQNKLKSTELLLKLHTNNKQTCRHNMQTTGTTYRDANMLTSRSARFTKRTGLDFSFKNSKEKKCLRMKLCWIWLITVQGVRVGAKDTCCLQILSDWFCSSF